ncbi:hypothetical protein ACFYXF_33125 [Streptomyces sp. NPDC002680]|uniref:hypothetical protein n=1 Tax=Streptomyces sp. NPDC002680 TaxID=3364659 RepID=UPI00367B0930
MTWLTDDGPAEPLWEGQLDLLESQPDRGEGESLDPRSLPVVAIGQPEAWPLADLYPADEMPPTLATRTAEHDFYLVRLHCSFRPTKEDVVIDWARFVVELHGDSPPTAEAIHPEVVEEEVATTRSFTLTPSLTFAKAAVTAGEAVFGIEYKTLQPFVWGAREPATTPSWDFQPTSGHRLYGSRRMHLLVRAPRGTVKGTARLHLTADVSVKRRLVGRAKARRDQPPLEVTLWNHSGA